MIPANPGLQIHPVGTVFDNAPTVLLAAEFDILEQEIAVHVPSYPAVDATLYVMVPLNPALHLQPVNAVIPLLFGGQLVQAGLEQTWDSLVEKQIPPSVAGLKIVRVRISTPLAHVTEQTE